MLGLLLSYNSNVSGYIVLFGLFSLIFGVISLLFGYKIFKIFVTILGFIIGAFLGAIASKHGSDPLLLNIMIGGLLGAVLIWIFYDIALFLSGAFFGIVVGLIIAGILHFPPNSAFLILMAVLGGILAFIITKFIIILASSLIGSFFAVLGFILLFTNYELMYYQTMAGQNSSGVWNFIIILLTIFGVLYQYGKIQKLKQIRNVEEFTNFTKEFKTEIFQKGQDENLSRNFGRTIRISKQKLDEFAKKAASVRMPVSQSKLIDLPIKLKFEQGGQIINLKGLLKGTAYYTTFGRKVLTGDEALAHIKFDPTDNTVSGMHAEISYQDGIINFKNLSTTNPSVVNGRTLAPGEAVTIQPGDRISMGIYNFIVL